MSRHRRGAPAAGRTRGAPARPRDSDDPYYAMLLEWLAAEAEEPAGAEPNAAGMPEALVRSERREGGSP